MKKEDVEQEKIEEKIEEKSEEKKRKFYQSNNFVHYYLAIKGIPKSKENI